MKRLSATEAISPAIEHIKSLLNLRRDWRLVLKVTAVAFFAQMAGFNFTGGIPPHSAHPPSTPGAALMVSILFGVALFFSLVALVLFYIGSRLQFVLFDVILNRQTIVAPSWRRFGRVTWRWIGLKLLLFAGMLVCLLPVFLPLFLHFIRTMPGAGGQVSHVQLGSFFATILSFVGLIFLLILIVSAIYCLLADFGLPFIALENTSIAETSRRLWSLIRAEPGECATYLLLRFVLVFGAGIGCEIAIAVLALLLAIPLGGVSLALWLGLRHSGSSGHLLMIAGWVVAGLLFLCCIILIAVVAFGYLFSFVQAYAIYFLAGRYPLLGETLDPTPGRPFTPPPPLRGPDEPGDDSGSAFPMDPIPA